MKKFKEFFNSYGAKDYFWWVKVYRRRLLYTFLVCELLLILLTTGFNKATNYRLWIVPKQETKTVETDRSKLEKCSKYVYTLMQENIRLQLECE